MPFKNKSSVYTQDTGEFSDGDSEDSGFEESVDLSDRKKEQRLQNDKYDMALEVSLLLSAVGPHCLRRGINW